MRDPGYWDPDHLFGEDLAALTETVELLADVPEMSLGITDERGGLNARRIAQLLSDWVNGETLPAMARRCFPEKSEQDGLRDVGRYVFREMTGQLPWGLGTLQLIAMGESASESAMQAARRVPAMAFYGVRTPGAVALRMVGLPRLAAESMGTNAPEFDSFDDARDWLRQRSSRAWSLAGRAGGVDGATLHRVWSLIST
jgi:hypothetical protein